MTASDLTVILFVNLSALKVAIADWHRQEFDRIEDSLTQETFFGSLFLDAFGHSDGVFLQLAAAFDVFACAVAFRVGLANPHKADFGGKTDDLVRATGGELGKLIRSTADDEGFRRLTDYRNLAAHRSVTTGRTVLRSNEETDRIEGRFTIGDSPPGGAPDPDKTPIRGVLEREVRWARRALYDLYPLAVATWGLAGDDRLRPDLGLRERKGRPSVTGSQVELLITEEELLEDE